MLFLVIFSIHLISTLKASSLQIFKTHNLTGRITSSSKEKHLNYKNILRKWKRNKNQSEAALVARSIVFCNLILIRASLGWKGAFSWWQIILEIFPLCLSQRVQFQFNHFKENPQAHVTNSKPFAICLRYNKEGGPIFNILAIGRNLVYYYFTLLTITLLHVSSLSRQYL